MSNGLGYLLNVAAVALLEPARLGEFAAWLAVVVVTNTGAVALQAVAARRIASARAASLDPASQVREMLVAAGWAAGLLCGVLVVLAPLVARVLHASVVGTLLVALVMVPLTISGVLLGILQGWERFGHLAVAYLLLAVGKVGGGAVGLALGGPELALAGMGVGAVVATVAVAALAAPHLPGSPLHAAVPSVRRASMEVAQAAGTVGAIFALAAADILSARATLPGEGSGSYALGNIVTRGAFWLPQFVAVLAFPRLADPARRTRSLTVSVLVITALGATTVVLAAALGDQVVGTLGSGDYAEAAHQLKWFALLGSLQAAVQLLVYDGLARRRRATAPVVWVGALVVLVVSSGAADTVGTIVKAAAAVTGVVATTLLLLAVRDRRASIEPARSTT